MRQSRLLRAAGIVLVALVVLSIGHRPTIRAGQPIPTVASAAVGGGIGDEAGKPTIVHIKAKATSKEAAKVWLKLQEKIPMAFPNETPLEDVLKYIRSSTVDKSDFPDGLPIYLDPAGLQEAERTATAPVVIDLKAIPLGTCLKLILDQCGLAYMIHPDGLVVITNKESEELPVDSEAVILEELSALRDEVRLLREELRFSRGMPASGGMFSGPLSSPPESKPAGGLGNRGGMM